jgi:hypothetical protein
VRRGAPTLKAIADKLAVNGLCICSDFLPTELIAALEIWPEGGTLVAFLSDRFEHEVLPARRQRLSLTGWFRQRGQHL